MSDVKIHYQTTPADMTDGTDTSPRADIKGNLRVNPSGGGAPAAAADATANPTIFGHLAYMLGFNGATWDRIRTGIVAKTATFTGLLNAIAMARFNATPAALSDGDVQLIQVDPSGNIRTSPGFSSSTDTGADLSLADTLSHQFASKATTSGMAIFCAPIANTVAVYLGRATGVTTSLGIELNPGDSIPLPCANTNEYWAITGTATQHVRVITL